MVIPEEIDGNPVTMAWVESSDGAISWPIDLDDLEGEVQRLTSAGHDVKVHFICDLGDTTSRYGRVRTGKEIVPE